jgi:4'-phosphopantetheinyl transferase
VQVTADSDGRPKLAAPSSLDFNLSHTKRAVLLGLTEAGRIGVDVEPAERDLMRLRIAPAACTPVEAARLDALAPERRNEYLVRLWTLKEAHAKALGSGLAAGFTGFGFDLAGDSAARVDEPGRPPADGAWKYRSWRVEQLWASAAIAEPFSDKETP